MKPARDWNWCFWCRDMVVVSGRGDGSIAKCSGCKRRFVVTYFNDGFTQKWSLLPLSTNQQGEARKHARDMERKGKRP